MSLADVSIKKPITTIMIVIGVMVLGMVSLTKLAIDLLPDVSFPIVAVFTEYKGAGPSEVERMVSEPVEMVVSSVKGVKTVNSTSTEESSVVIIEFNWGTNMDLAANDVREGLSRISEALPDGVTDPLVFKFDPSMMPIMVLRVSGDMDPAELKRFTDDEIVYKIKQVDGVAMAIAMGGLEREIQVELNLSRMAAMGISADQVVSILRMENFNLPSGMLKSGHKEIILRTVGEFRNIKQIENVIVANKGGIPIYLKDISKVYDGFKEKNNDMKVDGKNAVVITVMKQSGSNTVQVSKKIKKQIEIIKKGLSKDVEISPVMDSAKYIEQSITQVRNSAVLGGLFVILILFVFLRSIRSTAIITFAIPVSIIASFVLIYFSGLSLNMMTLGGLALGIGMLVDNAIVVLENIFRHRENGESKIEAASKGTSEVSMAISASTITTICVFVPILFVSGIAGVFFMNMAWAVTFSLMASLVMALTLVPVLCSKFLEMRKKKSEKNETVKINSFKEKFLDITDKMLDDMDYGYKKIIAWSLAHRKMVIYGSFLLLFLSLILVPFAKLEFMPETDEGMFSATVKMPAGTKLSVTTEVCSQVEKIFRENTPEIESSFVQAGSGGSYMSMMGGSNTNTGSMRVNLVERNKRKRSSKQIVDDLRAKLAGKIPDAEILFNQISGGAMMGMGGGSAIQITISGYDLNEGALLAQKVADAVRSVKGTNEVRIDREEGLSEYRFIVDRDKASVLGLSMAQIANSIGTNVKGTVASMFREGGHEYNIFVRLREEDRKLLEDVENISMTSMTGRQIALKNVVSVEESVGPINISRKSQKRIITVLAGLSGTKDLGSAVKEIRSKLKDIVIPKDFKVEFAGRQEEMANSFRDLALAFILAALLVYLVMASQFESLLDPFIIMFSVPLSLIGVIWMLFLTGSIFNVVVFIGVIMLAGIVVNNGIVLVSYTNILRERGMPLREAVLEGGRTRLRPILMTTLTTILGLIPMATGIGEGSELVAPIARAVIGGLSISTIFTLVFMPTLYTVFEERIKRKNGN